MRGLFNTLDRVIAEGRLELVAPDGQRRRFGPGPSPDVAVRVEDTALDLDLLLDPELRLAEAVIDGRIALERGSLYDLVTLYFRNKSRLAQIPGQRLARGLAGLWRSLAGAISPRAARRNAAFHYDLGNAFYRLWLDRDMQYSCGYFPSPGADLDAAQTAKKRHIAAKLALRPGQRVLDIGCGWGGLALYLAMAADVAVTGITLSREQAEVARARAGHLGLGDRVRFELSDYRDVADRFDRIVSVGMLEHVGAAALPRFFREVHDRLAPDGVALVHAIGTMGPPGPTPSFLTRYIFPGGYTPALSEAMAAVEGSGLWALDCEVLRLHYADTLAAWRARFLEQRSAVVAERGERFARMWELYLAGCEAAFRHGRSMVFQLQLARERDAAPRTRDYLAGAEAALAAREPAVLPRLYASADAVLGPTPADPRPLPLPLPLRAGGAAG